MGVAEEIPVSEQKDPLGSGVLPCRADEGQRERAWASFRDDPEWQQVRAASEVDGPLTTRITNALWAPTDFSPLQ